MECPCCAVSFPVNDDKWHYHTTMGRIWWDSDIIAHLGSCTDVIISPNWKMNTETKCWLNVSSMFVRRRHNVGSMLGQRPYCWPNSDPTSDENQMPLSNSDSTPDYLGFYLSIFFPAFLLIFILSVTFRKLSSLSFRLLILSARGLIFFYENLGDQRVFNLKSS